LRGGRVVPSTRARPFREYVGGESRDWVLRVVWATTLLAEYRVVLHILWGDRVYSVDLEEVEGGGGELDEYTVDKVYRALTSVERGGGDWVPGLWGCREAVEAVRYARRARETLNPDYYAEAARILDRLLGLSDGWVSVLAYRRVEGDIGLTRRDAEEIVKLGDRIAEAMAKLGRERAERELRRLVFEGYRENIVDTVEGLDRGDRELLKRVLAKPYERAAILFAYKKIGDFRKLQNEILLTVFYRNTFAFISDPAYIPEIDGYL